MTIQWTPAAVVSARRFMHDQDGMRAIGAAVGFLADDPYPAEAFHRGRYHQLRVGAYRVLYVVDEDVITIKRVDRPGKLIFQLGGDGRQVRVSQVKHSPLLIAPVP